MSTPDTKHMALIISVVKTVYPHVIDALICALDINTVGLSQDDVYEFTKIACGEYDFMLSPTK